MLKLIRAFLRSGAMVDGVSQPSEKGTPQSGPLSPLLSNILLDDLDKELEQRGHRFCRYADDCNVYVGSRRSGERVLESLTRFLEEEVKLKVNRAQSAVDRPANRVYLGYSFTLHRQTKIRVPAKTGQKMKAKVKERFRAARGRNVERFIRETLNPLLRGWMNCFRLSEPRGFAEELDGWIRRRLRRVIGASGSVRRLGSGAFGRSGSTRLGSAPAAITAAARGSTAALPTCTPPSQRRPLPPWASSTCSTP